MEALQSNKQRQSVYKQHRAKLTPLWPSALRSQSDILCVERRGASANTWHWHTQPQPAVLTPPKHPLRNTSSPFPPFHHYNESTSCNATATVVQSTHSGKKEKVHLESKSSAERNLHLCTQSHGLNYWKTVDRFACILSSPLFSLSRAEQFAKHCDQGRAQNN